MAVPLREYNNDDYPPFIYLFQPLEFRVVKIERRIDVVRYSFLAQRSITYLDLNTCEYSKREKRIFTTEAFRNRIDNRRKTLYTFHLDLTKELDPGPPKAIKFDVVHTDLSKHVCTDDDFCFYFQKVQVSCKNVYGQECDKQLKNILLERIPKSQNKIEAALKYAKVLSSLKCSCKFDQALTLFLKELFDDREHSALAVEFIKFKESILSYLVVKGKQAELDWALFHATRLNYNLMQGFRFNYTASLRMFTIKIPLLLGYGYLYPFSSLNFPETLFHDLSFKLQSMNLRGSRYSLRKVRTPVKPVILLLPDLFIYYPSSTFVRMDKARKYKETKRVLQDLFPKFLKLLEEYEQKSPLFPRSDDTARDASKPVGKTSVNQPSLDKTRKERAKRALRANFPGFVSLVAEHLQKSSQ
ncbi:hypothetical protein NPIL_386091 [Nephila pilipes]|uniref:Uncharacterized protein n=1 Tax=Nephila pilipes TaxID=299642 RepID=A0A8X6MIC1_NEPPI|nr:hypothetical protein NPIL_386091 [Nephila pilipes]